MVLKLAPSPATGSSLVAGSDLAQPVCPLCHTRQSLTIEALEERGSWRCARCGQLWDAARLAAVAGYAAWTSERLARTS